jgi:antitoxin YobK
MSASEAILTDIVALVKSNTRQKTEAQCPVTDIELDAVERELGMRLPSSYRQFLKRCGAGRVGNVDVFGLPRNRLWGDLVLMNELAGRQQPAGYLKFAVDWTGRAYYFDTSKPSADAEWPVLVLDAPDAPRLVASSFLDFVGKLIQGPITIELQR